MAISFRGATVYHKRRDALIIIAKGKFPSTNIYGKEKSFMTEPLSLDRLLEGQIAQVQCLRSSQTMRRRLQDLGFIEGTRVECLHRSPAGDPIAFLIRGAMIALRREDAVGVLVSLT
ncbi:MAG: FeoA family protein [Oscillospiraceae bacterium]